MIRYFLLCLVVLSITWKLNSAASVFSQIPQSSLQHHGEETGFHRTRIESVHVNGTTYVSVVNLKLPFLKAEQYCQTEFPSPMHLTSIANEEEWKFLQENFQDVLGASVWLGGILSNNDGDISLDWTDRTTVNYHNLTTDQLSFLAKQLKKDAPVPIVGELSTGMWSFELLEDHDRDDLTNLFICKAHQSSVESHSPRLDSLHPHFDMMNAFVRSMMFGDFEPMMSRMFRYRHGHPFNSRHWHQFSYPRRFPTQARSEETSHAKRANSEAINLGPIDKKANKDKQETTNPKENVKDIVPKHL